MRSVLFSGLVGLATILAWPVAALAAAPVTPPATTAAQGAPETVEEWTARAEHGDHRAEAHLCDLYFGDEGSMFDPTKAAAWCHAAGNSGYALGLWRMGLLTLAGVAVPRDLEAAEGLCLEAASHDARVPSGFCLAAIAKERRRASAETASSDAPPKTIPQANAADTKDIAHWRDLADRGDRSATAHLCKSFFDAESGAFNSGLAADWCRRAAGYGDGNAMRRLGLMRFWGVGMEKSSPGAEALCDEAHAHDTLVSSGFCVAAVRAERTRTEAALNPSQFAYPAPWPAASGLASVSSALGPDRMLETMHTGADGLRYNCRELINWSRYGLQLDGLMFGRPIQQFGTADYAALDAGAQDCATALAPYDQDGSQRRLLADFRAMLPSLQKHQQQLARNSADQKTELQRQGREDADRNRDFLLVVAGLSQPQDQCIAAVRRAWLAKRFSPAAHSLEIRSVATDEIDGNVVVTGNARVIGNLMEDDGTPSTYTCTFDGQSQRLLSTSVAPRSTARPTTAAP